jgi:hypothetical protein
MAGGLYTDPSGKGLTSGKSSQRLIVVIISVVIRGMIVFMTMAVGSCIAMPVAMVIMFTIVTLVSMVIVFSMVVGPIAITTMCIAMAIIMMAPERNS